MTPRQRECLNIYRELTVDGVPPTYEAVAERMGLYKSGVHRMLHALRDKGVVALTPGAARSVAIRNEHAEAIPFDAMADAVADLVATGKRLYPAEIKRALVLAYAGFQ